MVSFEWYRSFIAIYRAGTVSSAAQALHLTQPAVSQHLVALERALKTLLFERTPRLMVPTEGGKRLYTQIADAVERLESVASEVHAEDTPLLIRLGTPHEFFIERILMQLPSEDRSRYAITFELSQVLIEKLGEGHLDAVVSTQKISRSDIEYRLLFEEKFWLVGPPTIEMPHFKSDSQEELIQLEHWLKTQPWIAYSEELPIIRRFWRQVFERRIDANPQFVIPDLGGIRQAVKCGLGLSVLPDYLCESWVEEHSLTLVLNPRKAVTNEIWLAFQKSQRQTQRIKLLLKLLNAR